MVLTTFVLPWELPGNVSFSASFFFGKLTRSIF